MMERFIIGKCRNDKIVTSEPKHDGLVSPDEMFDAMAMIETLAAKEFRRNGESDLYIMLQNNSENIRNDLSKSKQIIYQMKLVGIETSLDIRRYAQLLLRQEFKD